MEFHSDSGKEPRGHKAEKTLHSTSSRQAKQSQKLGSILKFEKETYDDFHPRVVKNMDKFSPNSRKFHQKHVELNSNKSEELVKYMSNLPSYLEKGKKPQEKAFDIGVLDWRLLENWQHNNYNDVMHINGKNSHSRNNSSSFMSSEGSSSSSRCNRDNSSSTTEGSSNGTNPFARNGEEFQDRKNGLIKKVLQGVPPVTQSSSLKNVNNIKECKIKESGLSRFPERRSKCFQTNEITSGLQGKSTERNCSSEMKKMPSLPGSVSVSPSRRKNMEDKTSCGVIPRKLVEDEVPQLKVGVKESTKVRNGSPNRRFSFGLGRTGKTSSSNVSSDEKKLVSEKIRESNMTSNSGNSTCDQSNSNGRCRSSPLRRLLDPLLKSKGRGESNQFDKTLKSMKINLDQKGRTGNNGKSTIQALLQVAVKNGLPLFTFTVDNCSDILAATVKESSSPKKGWICTFFSFSEMQKKNANWMNKGSKDRHHTYISNVVAQMRVSAIKFNIRECVLTSDSLPNDELAAIIVKFPESKSENVNQDLMNESGNDVTVILPGGDHGVPRKGDPWPLIERWRTGGLCDCGGWDLGCRIRVLANSHQSCQRFNSVKSESTTTFKLFSQDEVEENNPFFTLSPFEDSMFSVEFNSSLQLIQAFSIGIATMNSRTMDFLSPNMAGENNNANSKERISARSATEVSAEYASYPPLSPVCTSVDCNIA